MFDLPDSTRSHSSSQAPSQVRDFGYSIEGEALDQELKDELISQANTVPLLKIFQRYGIACDQRNYIIRCPFKSHKGGQERTASFIYYHETNSFHCQGCKKGGQFAHATHFVSFMEGVPYEKAAKKIIELFKDDLGIVGEEDVSFHDYQKLLDLQVEFSTMVREFLQTHNTLEAQIYVEVACQAYDELHLRYKMNSIALRAAIEICKKYIEGYQK
jgi:DNA primase